MIMASLVLFIKEAIRLIKSLGLMVITIFVIVIN